MACLTLPFKKKKKKKTTLFGPKITFFRLSHITNCTPDGGENWEQSDLGL